MTNGKIIIKHNGLVILRDNDISLVSDTPYLSVADGALEEILDSKTNAYTYNDNVKCDSDEEKQKEWKKIQRVFSSIESNTTKTEQYITMLRKAQSKKDLRKIFYDIMQNIFLADRKVISELYAKYPDLVLSIMSKSIVQSFVKNRINKLIPSKIIKYEVRKIDGESLEQLMKKILNIDLSEQSTNGVDKLLAKSLNDELDTSYKRLSSSCFECANGYVANCEKIADYPRKKDISEYPFVTDGFQVYVNDELDKFIVMKCKNYKKAYQRASLTPQQVGRLNLAKKLMETLYFDAKDLDEAREIGARNKSLGYH